MFGGHRKSARCNYQISILSSMLKNEGKKESGDESYIDYLEWYTKHESECLKNHEGSSGVSTYNN